PPAPAAAPAPPNRPDHELGRNRAERRGELAGVPVGRGADGDAALTERALVGERPARVRRAEGVAQASVARADPGAGREQGARDRVEPWAQHLVRTPPG